jgi:predicted nucleic acid-binding protein
MDSLMGIDSNAVVDEIAIKTEAVTKDALDIVSQKKNIWCALPAPHALGITDSYYHDKDEWQDAIAGAYHTLLRSMRDGGIAGHVLICDTIDEVELSALSRQKVVFFARDPDREGLASLMEYQRQVAVDRHHLATVFDLAHEYEINKLIILDPDTESIALALSEFDPDQLMAGGYCTGVGEGYWKKLVASAKYTI